MRRSVRVLVGTVVAAGVALAGLTGCTPLGRGGDDAQDVAMSNLSWEAQALESIGYATDQLSAADDPTANPSTGSGTAQERRGKFRRLRFGFGRNVLHAEAVVQTDEGLTTVVAQRGTVTAIDEKSITVRSADGYTLTWNFGDPIRVIERRKTVQPSAIAVGTEVGLAGAREGETVTARLIVVPFAQK